MGRAPCCDKANVKKGPWSPEEDAKLKEYIEKNGTGGNWIALPQKVGLKRCGKSCRLRWLNYLRPHIKHGDFTEEEDRIICNLYANIGSRWSIIASQLPGRTDNDIKNYWNTKLKKKAMAINGMGLRTNMPISHHHHYHHQRNINSSTPSSSSPSHLSSSSTTSSSSSLSYNFSNNTCYNTSGGLFEQAPLLIPSTSLSTGNNSIFYPHESFSSSMQFYPVIKEGPLMAVGGENSCSSSDGSINNGAGASATTDHHHQQQMGFQGFTIMEENQKIWGDDDPSDYGFEEIKQLISTDNISCNSYLFDENKAEEGVMYY